MKHFRFTIRQLMLATLGLALGIVVVLYPTLFLFWILAGASIVVTAGLLAAGRWHRLPSIRAASLSAAIFAGPHVLSFMEDVLGAWWIGTIYGGHVVYGYSDLVLWNVPDHRFGYRANDATDGIDRWIMCWIWGAVGWLLGLALFENWRIRQSIARLIQGVPGWLPVAGIVLFFLAAASFLFHEFPRRDWNFMPGVLLAGFYPPVCLAIWQTVAVLAAFGDVRKRPARTAFVVYAALWLAIAFVPGWSSTLGPFQPHAMVVRYVATPTSSMFLAIHYEPKPPVRAPAIVQGEEYPASMPDPIRFSKNQDVDYRPKTFHHYLTGGVIREYVPDAYVSIELAGAACLSALAVGWLAAMSVTVGAHKPRQLALTVALVLLLGAAVWSRQAWVVQIALLIVYLTLARRMWLSLQGDAASRCEHGWVAFAMVFWLLLACGPWFMDHVRPWLPTTIACKWIDQRLGCRPGEPGHDMSLSDDMRERIGRYGALTLWPRVVAGLGLDHRYPLSTPANLLMAIPVGWAIGCMARRLRR